MEIPVALLIFPQEKIVNERLSPVGRAVDGRAFLRNTSWILQFQLSRSGGMADALDSKSSHLKVVRVQLPPPVLQ